MRFPDQAHRRAQRSGAVVLPHLLAAAPGVWLTAVFVAPLLVTVALSFAHAGFGDVTFGFTLDNYRTALRGLYAQTFVQTVVLAVGCSALSLLLGMPIAYFIARHAGRLAGPLLAAILLPYFSSFLIRVLSWQVILATGGPVDVVLHAVGLLHEPLDLLGTRAAVVIGIVYGYLPIAVLPQYVVFSRIPLSTTDAAADLGAGSWRRFTSVVLPLARPGVATAALLTAVPMLGELVVPQLLGGGRGLLLGQLVQTQYVQSQNYALGSAIAVLILVAVGVLVALLLRLTRGFDDVPR
jgi:spermidine/putrescine transport system permease protein